MKTSLFYPVTAITNRLGTTTVVNEGYAATGPPTLPYDYPYIEVNGGIVNTVSTFHPPGNRTRKSKKTGKRNSTNTLGYIEVNQNTQPTTSGYTTLRQSNGSSIVEQTIAGNSTDDNPYISMKNVIEEPTSKHNSINTPEQFTGGNSTDDNSYVSMKSVIEEPSQSPVERHTDTKNLLSPPASSTESQNIQTNTNNNNGYITIHK